VCRTAFLLGSAVITSRRSATLSDEHTLLIAATLQRHGLSKAHAHVPGLHGSPGTFCSDDIGGCCSSLRFESEMDRRGEIFSGFAGLLVAGLLAVAGLRRTGGDDCTEALSGGIPNRPRSLAGADEETGKLASARRGGTTVSERWVPGDSVLLAAHDSSHELAARGQAAKWIAGVARSSSALLALTSQNLQITSASGNEGAREGASTAGVPGPL
jgi:hypothetical protein